MTPAILSTSAHITLETDKPDRPRSGLLTWLSRFVLAGFLFYTFIGTQAFSAGSAETRADGSLLDRVLVLGLFGGAVILLIAHFQRTMRCLTANALFFALVLFCIASIVWSNFPGLTLRRSLLLFFLASIVMAVIVSVEDLRRLHTILFVSLSAIVFFNLVLSVAVPSIGMSEIGARGLYSQKNVAGIVAMATVILGVAWIMGSASTLQSWLAVAAMVPTAIFLVLTKSKTSINLTALGVLVLVAFALAERYGPKFIITAGILGAVLAAGLLAWLATLNFDIDAATRLVIGDTSFSGRDELWAFVRRDAEKNYWLGHGYGAYWDVGIGNDPLQRAEAGSWLADVPIGLINQAHDGYLELWLHVGLPAAVVATAVVLLGIISGLLFAMSSRHYIEDRALVGGFTVLLVLYLLHNFTEATLFMRGAIFFSLAMMGLFLTPQARQLAREEDETGAGD